MPPPPAMRDASQTPDFRDRQDRDPPHEFIREIRHTALAITTRTQLTAWVQGSLRMLIPHQKALLGFGQIGYGTLRMDLVHGVDLPTTYFAAIQSETRQWISPVAEKWFQDRVPQFFLPSHFPQRKELRWRDNLAQHQIENGVMDASIDCISGRVCFITLFNIGRTSEDAAKVLRQCVTPLLADIWTRIDTHFFDMHAPQLNRDVRNDPPFSPAERDILPWLRAGKTNWEIAQVLSKSENTVKTQIQKMLKKTGFLNRRTLAASDY